MPCAADCVLTCTCVAFDAYVVCIVRCLGMTKRRYVRITADGFVMIVTLGSSDFAITKSSLRGHSITIRPHPLQVL